MGPLYRKRLEVPYRAGRVQVWSEYPPTGEKIEYMAFPRLCALAEVLWTERGARAGLADFRGRLAAHPLRLEAGGVRYRSLEDPPQALSIA